MKLKGHIQKRFVKCGKQNCKCANGKKHTAFYRVWFDYGQRFQSYVRKSDVEKVSKACDDFRASVKQMRSARIEYKQLLASFREISRGEN